MSVLERCPYYIEEPLRVTFSVTLTIEEPSRLTFSVIVACRASCLLFNHIMDMFVPLHVVLDGEAKNTSRFHTININVVHC